MCVCVCVYFCVSEGGDMGLLIKLVPKVFVYAILFVGSKTLGTCIFDKVLNFLINNFKLQKV